MIKRSISHSFPPFSSQKIEESVAFAMGKEKKGALEKEEANNRNRPNDHPYASNRPQKNTKPDAPEKKLFLIDTMALLYRSHFALHRHGRRNSKNMEVGALFGFANTLVSIINKELPTHVIALYDCKEPTWRKEIYPDYKIHRQAQPEAITTAIPYSYRLLEAFGIPLIRKPGYEADDLIGTLAKKGAQEGYRVYIVSRDKDFAQLVGPNVALYHLGNAGSPSKILTQEEVLASWDIDHPSQVIDILGLCGDSVDNIPGVPGIGKKGAQKLVATYGSVENTIAAVEKLPPRQRKAIAAHREQAILSKRLATITTDIPLAIKWEESTYSGFKEHLLAPLLEELEFRQLAKRLLGYPLGGLFGQARDHDGKVSATDTKTYTILQDESSLQVLVKEIAAAPAFAFAIKSRGEHPKDPTIEGFTITYESNKGYYIPIGGPQGLPWKKVKSHLEGIFKDHNKIKVGYDIKSHLRILHHHGLKPQPPFFDAMIAEHLLAPDRPTRFGALATSYDHLLHQEALPHSLCEQVANLADIHPQQRERLQKEGFDSLFYDVLLPILSVLTKMEDRGIALDVRRLEKLGEELMTKITALESDIYELAGVRFNINSPKQVGEILFEQLKIVAKAPKTAKGRYTTNEMTLRKLLTRHPIVGKILEHRTYKKMKSTFVDTLPKQVGPDGNIHTTYNQAVVSTGRLSSTNPNMQNIPIQDEWGKAIRSAFVPSKEGDLLLSADYSQIELRIMAHLSQDPTMVAAFQKGGDIHRRTASHLFHVAESAITPAMRRKAKVVNFGIIYGMSSFGLSKQLEIPRSEAQQIIDNYFDKFPAIKAYTERTIAEAREKGYVKTFLGRKRFLPDLNSKNKTIREMAERFAINMPIQGMMAEMIQKAMIAIDKWITDSNIPLHMLLQIHDELLFELSPTILEETKTQVTRYMREAMPLKVPIEVNIGVGNNWSEAH